MFVVTGIGVISAGASQEIERLRLLADDLERIEQGELPTTQDLATAPLLENYQIGGRTVPALVGDVHGHPRIGTTVATTTTLWAYAPSLGWARTQSRFYRLLPGAAGATR